MSRRVLVTGASGFIGRHVLPLLLAQGDEVHAQCRTLPEQDLTTGPLADIQWHSADLLQPGAAEGLMETIRPSHWLHFAWTTTPGLYWRSPENLAWIRASLSLLEAFHRTGGQRVVMAGTCAEYDWSAGGHCVEDETPLRPGTLYGASKNALRQIVESFAQTHGLSAAWGRIFFLHGPHERPERLVPSTILSLLRSEPARCSHGEQIRDFLHVEDVAAAFVSLLNSDLQGAVNIASGEPRPLREVVLTIGRLLRRESLVHLGALPAKEDEPPAITADVRKLREQLGWQPRANLEEGLLQTIDWWKAACSPDRIMAGCAGQRPHPSHIERRPLS